MVCDGAGFHTAKALNVPKHVTLVKLPPYSPELNSPELNSPEPNPLQNLWHYLKSHYWRHRAYTDYEEIEDAAMTAWQLAVLNKHLMKTVPAAPYNNSDNLN